MRYLDFTSYVRGRLPPELIDRLRPYFEDLEADVIDYKQHGFQSRTRRFGAFSFTGEKFTHDPSLAPRFNVRKQFHTQYMGTPPAGLTETSLATGIFDAVLQAVLAVSPIKPGSDYMFGINLVRVRADDDHMGAPAPGLHRDGYDYSCHINVSRHNVSGGTSILAMTPRPDTVIVECDLAPGELVFFNDRTIYHTASPVTPRCGGHETWRDMVIVDMLAYHHQFTTEHSQARGGSHGLEMT
jgi:hypothetical protein